MARLDALVRGLVSSAVLPGAVPTGPRNADAFNMPGFKPAACPPDDDGGGVNGSAGLAKLVTPGAAPEPTPGDIDCTGGLAGIEAAGAFTAADDGGKNIPDTGGCDCGTDGDTGAVLVTFAIGEIPDVLVLVFAADSGA